MLNDDQLDVLGETLVPLFAYLEREVIADIARRIKKTLTYTRTAELQALSMRELGYSPAKIRKEVMKMLNADPAYRKEVAKNTLEYKREVRKIINDIINKAYIAGNEVVAGAGDMAWVDDLSVWKDAGKQLTDNSFLPQLVEAFSAQTAGALNNMSQTTGFKTMSGYESIENAYKRELDKAIIKICSGTFSSEKVLRDTVHSLAQSGLRSVDFASGYSMQLDTAARVAVRTGCHQLSAKVMDKNIVQTGENLVYVSKHWGARNTGTGHANHEQWQGKVYFIRDGEDYSDEAKRIGQDRITSLWYATGYSVDDSHQNDPLGLNGYNCRHNHHPWFEGASTLPKESPEPQPVKINGKEYDYYAITQKQRSMERSIRALKREKEALKALNMDTTEIDARIKRKRAEYSDFCKQAGVKEKPERLRYESGTSDLKKTQAWKRYKEATNYSDTNSEDYKTDVPGFNTIFDGKSELEKTNIAKEIVSGYTDRECGWNGRVIVNKDLGANGKFCIDGHIEYKENVGNRTIIHEMLHAYSVPHTDKIKRREARRIEEASVELFAREICNREQIPYQFVFKANVDALIRINEIVGIENNIFDYAERVYNVNPNRRLRWLSTKVNLYIRENKAYQDELTDLLERFYR